jgi:hypothetical protein
MVKRSEQLIGILKEEGLSIQDEAGMPFESYEEKEEAYHNAMDYNKPGIPIPEWMDNEDAWEYEAQRHDNAIELDKKHFKIHGYFLTNRFIPQSRGILIRDLMWHAYNFINAENSVYTAPKLHKDRRGFEFTHMESRWGFYVRWDERAQDLYIETDEGITGSGGHARTMEEFKDWVILINEDQNPITNE